MRVRCIAVVRVSGQVRGGSSTVQLLSTCWPPYEKSESWPSPVGRSFLVSVVGDAIIAFQRDVLPNGKWRPGGGASLSTFFIGQCLFRYGNAVQQWQREDRRNREGPADPADGSRDH